MKIIKYYYCLILCFLVLGHSSSLAERYTAVLSADAYTQVWQSLASEIGFINFVHWANPSVNWYLNTNGAGDGLTYNETYGAVNSAFYSWEALANSSISFNYSGSTSSTWAYDYDNVVYWAEDGDPAFNDGGPLSNPNVIGVRVMVYNSDFEILDADILLNGKNHPWNLTGVGAVDIQSAATHEIGHMIGVHHTEVTTSPLPTMYNYYVGTDMRSLEFDDEVAATFLYGGILLRDVTLPHNINYFYWDVTVPQGISLNFAGNATKLRMKSGVGITVNGSITANQITFEPISGSWGGIEINSGGSATISYADIQNAAIGVKFGSGSSGSVTNSTVSDCYYDIYVYQSTPTIESNTISSNTYGIYVTNSYTTLTSTEYIKSNTIQSNSGYGIHLNNSSPTLSLNTITGNNMGVALFTNCNPTINQNSITSNSNYGLAIYASSSPRLFYALNDFGGRNSIQSNGEEEIKITGTSNPDLGNYKYDGLNSIIDASGYLIYNATGNTISAEKIGGVIVLDQI